jgi:hypothetical protein
MSAWAGRLPPGRGGLPRAFSTGRPWGGLRAIPVRAASRAAASATGAGGRCRTAASIVAQCWWRALRGGRGSRGCNGARPPVAYAWRARWTLALDMPHSRGMSRVGTR